MKGAGEKFDLTSNEEILKVNSPKAYLGGPFCVVSKNAEDRWALVAIKWEGKPRLGIRWFWGKHGQPITIGGHGTWFVIPPTLNNSIISALQLSPLGKKMLIEFLSLPLSQKNKIEESAKQLNAIKTLQLK